MADSGNKGHERIRRRIYGGVLIFAAAVFVSLTVIPAIRARLVDRVHFLEAAASGGTQPVITPIGENDIPYPDEFMRPSSSAVVSRPTGESTQKRLIVVQSDVSSITPPVLLGSADAGRFAETEQDDNEDSPRFLQGEIEREAYEKTLAANEKLALMIQDGNHELSFKTWGAALMDGGVYWVRVIFQNESGADVEYIWQTDISSGKTAPLNFNARSL